MTMKNDMSIFSRRESEVRSYIRNWPTVFDTAKGSWIRDESGRDYLDFFAGAGTLNYGHNNPVFKEALLEYISRDAITHSLDQATVAKRDLLVAIEDRLLTPRNLDYKVQFPGPTGTNAVEAALKLARKVTGRESVVNFTNAFHGMTLGALAVTGNSMKRAGAGVPLVHSTPMPFDNYFGGVSEDFHWFSRVLDDSGSGLNKPAAVIVETIQGEGGINVARAEWLRALAELCADRGILLIVDDVQMGCGRTGAFFSFEEAGITPDIVVLSKSIGGYGLPMALTLFKSELDVWGPGEHNGTFRGNNHAFVTARAALDTYWSDDVLEKDTLRKGELVGGLMQNLADSLPGLSHRGRGLVRGLHFEQGDMAAKACKVAFEAGLIVETSGPSDEVIKLLPALTTTDEELTQGMSILAESVAKVLA